jgi:hypothetical protein
MHTSSYRAAFKYGLFIAALILALPLSLVAQQVSFTRTAAALKTTSVEPVAPMSFVSTPREVRHEHRFWDNQNRALFATVAALGAADFCVTRANLANGGRELNPITGVLSGSTPGLAANFALETSGVVGVSYFFHKTGHHKLERLTSLVNIGASSGAVAYDLAHR